MRGLDHVWRASRERTPWREKLLCATKKPSSTRRSLLEPRAFSDPPLDCNVDRSRRPSTRTSAWLRVQRWPMLSNFKSGSSLSRIFFGVCSLSNKPTVPNFRSAYRTGRGPTARARLCGGNLTHPVVLAPHPQALMFVRGVQSPVVSNCMIHTEPFHIQLRLHYYYCSVTHK